MAVGLFFNGPGCVSHIFAEEEFKSGQGNERQRREEVNHEEEEKYQRENLRQKQEISQWI